MMFTLDTRVIFPASVSRLLFLGGPSCRRPWCLFIFVLEVGNYLGYQLDGYGEALTHKTPQEQGLKTVLHGSVHVDAIL